MKSNNKKQLTDRINRLSNVSTTGTIQKQRISFPLLLLLLSIGSFTFFAFQKITKEKPIINISSDNLNILYIGIENPITIAVEGISNEEVKVSSEDLELQPNEYGKYMISPSKAGEATLVVETRDMKREMIFKVMEIPDPIAKAQSDDITLKSGAYPLEQIQNISGIYIDQQSVHDIDYEFVYCEVTRVPKQEDPFMRTSKTGVFGEKMKAVFKGAKEGDVFYIDKIRIKFSGKEEESKLNSLVFRVKKEE